MRRYRLIEHLLFPPTYVNQQNLRNRLEGKTILITGASSGIGEALAYRLADLPVHLILVARREERLSTIKREIEQKIARVSIFPADLRNQENMEELLAYLHILPNGLDIIVSNAGLSIRRSIHDSLDRYHDFQRTMAINYFAPVQLLLSTIPLLEKAQGQVINISSINALLLPVPHWAAYQASKTAFDTWFRSIAPELNSIGISTTSIYLPLVKTPMIEPTLAYRDMPAMRPDHVADIICKTIYTRKHKYKPWWIIFGQVASVTFRGLWDTLVPRLIKQRRK